MPFESGKVIIRRYLRGPWCTWAQPMRVIGDDEGGLLLWQPVGSDFATLVDEDGSTPHDVPPGEMRAPRLTLRAWERYDVLILMRPAVAHSVWWFFDGDRFAGWYVNLEAPYTRWTGGVETTDHLLDIVVTPEREWRWKDEAELELRVGHPLYFDRAAADEVRAEGERLTRLIDAGRFPFDGTHTGFRPDPAWPPPALGDHDPRYPIHRPA